MKASIKITSVGGGTITAGNFGDVTAGDFNFAIDKFGATDCEFDGNNSFFILYNGDNAANRNAFSSYTAYQFHLSGSTSGSLITKSFVDAILANNGVGESIVQLPEGVTITAWELGELNY